MRHPSRQDGNLRGTATAWPITADVGRGVLLVHLVLSPLVFSRLTTEAFESNKVALLMLAALALVGLGLWSALSWAFAATPAERREGPRRLIAGLLRDPLALGFLLFAASAAVSTATSISPWTSLLGANESYAGLGTLLAYVVLFFATRTLCRGPADGWLLLAPGAIAAATASMHAVLQFTHLDRIPWDEVSSFADQERPFAGLGHANILGAYLVTALPGVSAFAARAASRRDFGRLAALAAVAALALTAVFLTLSRGAWLTLACTAPLLAALAWRAGRRREVVIAGAVLLGVAVCATAWLGRSAAERARHLIDAGPRLEIWSAGLAVFREHPLTGTGPDTFRIAFTPKRTTAYWQMEWGQTPGRAHNEVIQVLATQGGLGGAALLLLLVGLAVTGVRAWRGASPESRALVAAVCAGVVAFGVQSLFNFTLAPLGTLFVTLAGVLSALGRPPVAAVEAPAVGRWPAPLLAVATLVGILPVALNMVEAQGTAAWWACCILLAAAAAAATWGIWGVLSPARASVGPRPARRAPAGAAIWAARAAVVALVVVAALKWVAEPYAAAVACRSGEMALAAGEPALADFREAVALAPHDEFYRVKLSAAARAAAASTADPHDHADLLSLARAAAEEGVRLAPASVPDQANEAGVLVEMARQGMASADEALAAFDEAVALDPINATLLAEAGESALLLGRPNAARDYFERGLAAEPGSGRLCAGLGRCALAHRQFEEAAALLDRADAAEWHGEGNAHATALQAAATAHLGAGHLAAAEAYAAKAVQGAPESTMARLLHARALEVLGRRAEALAEYRRALDFSPADTAAQNGLRRLETARGAQANRSASEGGPH
jgi:O-antigen ligase/tetratricopeptide (TPR) repeat protein